MSEKTKVRQVEKKEKKEKKKVDRYSHLDDGFRKVLKEEEAIREKLSQLRKDLGEKRDQRDDEMSKKRASEPEDTLSQEIRELQDQREKEKKRLRQKEDRSEDLKSILARSAISDSISDARFEHDQLKTESIHIKSQVRPLLDQIAKLQAEQGSLRAPQKFRSVKEIDVQLEQINKKKEQAAEKEYDSVLRDLGRKEHDLKSARVMMKTVTDNSTRLNEALDKAGELGTKQTDIEKRIKVLEDKMDKQREARRQHILESGKKKDSSNVETSAIAESLRKLNDQIEVKVKERQQKIKLRNEARKEDESGAEIQVLIKERASLQKELIQLEKTVPFKIVKIDEDFSGAVMGKGGVIADQLSRDFGCLISVNGATVQIRGGEEKDACAEAILAVVEEAKANRVTETVKYPPEFIKRSELTRMETTSGARIFPRKENEEVNLVGSAEEIAIAKELLAEFTLNAHREEVDLGEELGKIIRVKKFRDIQLASGVKTIFMNSQHKVIITGKKDCVDAAVKMVDEDIKTIGSDSVEIQIPNGVYFRDIIGTKGSRINTIEEQTKTMISIRKETIVVHGTKDGINECKQFLKSVFKENMNASVEISYQPQLLDLMNSPYRPPGGEPVEAPEEEKEVEAEGDDDAEEKVEEVEGEELNGEEKPAESNENGEPKSKKKRIRKKKPKTFLQYVIRTTGIDICRAHPPKSVIFVRGKVDAAKEAEKLIKDFLEANKVAIEKVPCPEGLPRFMKKGQVSSLLNSIRKLPGLTGAIPPRGAAVNFIEIFGSEDAVAAALPKAKELIDELATKIAVFSFERARSGAIVGKGGETIKSVEKEFKATLDIDKFNGKCYALVAEADSVKGITERLEAIIEEDKKERPTVADIDPTAKGSGKGYGKGSGKGSGKGKGGKGGKSGGGKGGKPASK